MAVSSNPKADQEYARGVELHRRQDYESAARAYGRALSHDVNHREALTNLGVVLRTLGRHEAACAAYTRAVALDPGDAGAQANLGNVLRDLGRFDAATQALRLAVEAEPQSGSHLYNLGMALRDVHAFKESRQVLAQAAKYSKNPAKARWEETVSLLASGDLKSGLPQLERRWALPGMKDHKPAFTPWDGKASLKGKTILLRAEQGYGDSIQFIRFAKNLKAKDARVVIKAPRELARLLKFCEGIDLVLVKGDRAPACDFEVGLLSLPGFLGLGPDRLGGDAYIVPDLPPAGIERAQGARLMVGLIWAGRPDHPNDRARTIALEKLMAVAHVPDIAFFSLQKGPRAADIVTQGVEGFILDSSGVIDDFLDCARVMMALDLIITVDTVTAHLAGALGRPVWLLAPYAGDWRWGATGTRSPWYKSMYLFRQKKPGDWDSVMTRVAEALKSNVARLKSQEDESGRESEE